MLKSKSSLGPTLDNPMVDVKILTQMWIGGALLDVGDTARLRRLDAKALIGAASPPRIEIITAPADTGDAPD